MTIIRGKRPIPLFRLIKANPPGRYRTKKIACRLSIPNWGYCTSAAQYIKAFTARNNLLPSAFIVHTREVTA